MHIHFRCECGRQFKAASGDSGRKSRCPDCGVVFIVPLDTAEDGYMPLAPVVERPDRTEIPPPATPAPEKRDHREAPTPPASPGPPESEPIGLFIEGRRPLHEKEDRPLDMSYWTAFRYPLKEPARLMLLSAGFLFSFFLGFLLLLLVATAGAPAMAVPFFLALRALIAVFLFLVFSFLGSFCVSIMLSTCSEEENPPPWPSIGELWHEVVKPGLRLIAVALISFLPLLVCMLREREYSVFGGVGLVRVLKPVFFFAGVFYMPMATLAAFFFGNTLSANPLAVITAIARTGRDYLALTGLAAGVALLGLAGLALLRESGQPRAGLALAWLVFFIFLSFALYVAMVISRMLGLLYRRNRGKMGWDYVRKIERENPSD